MADFVEQYVPAYKIGSGDISWIEIIEHIASKNKPVLLATGAADIEDVKRAVNKILLKNSNLILMHCNTNYTSDAANYDYLNLNAISSFKEMFPGIITGISDHMQSDIAVLGAVTLGARVIEKHFTDSTTRKGPDHPFSLTLSTFKEMVQKLKNFKVH